MKKKKWIRNLVIAIVILLIIGGIIYYAVSSAIAQSGDVNIRWSDVVQTLQTCAGYIWAIGIAVVLAVVICIACRKLKKQIRFMVRAQAGIAAVLVIAIAVNLMCSGPLATLLGQVFAEKYAMSDETVQQAKDLMDDIADEGIVLLKNEDGFLPMKSDINKLNVFGWSSTNPTYGGVGSGSAAEGNYISLLQGLENAGYEVNSELVDFYTNFQTERPSITLAAQDWTIPEPTMEEYDENGIFESAKEFSDTALIVLSRSGGENADLPRSITDENTMDSGEYGKQVVYTTQADDVDPSRHYLELSHREEEMVERVTSEFSNVIVIVNTNNPMELGWVNEADSIKSVLWVAGTGERGFDALGRILNGEVNPSGKLPDTYVYDNLANPAVSNYGDFEYENMSDVIMKEGEETWSNDLYASFVNYTEGIYVGYRFYETAAAEGLIDYDQTVLYPFGYGLSYTTFDKEISSIETDGDTISLTVTVTNTGSTAGKDVVEIYYTPPYYNGGIEKSEVNLVQFEKTKLLEPQETQEIEISFKYEDMASYDYENNGCYVLEHGDYQISLRSDSHTVLDSKTVSVGEDVIYNEENAGARSTDQIVAENQFDFAEGDIIYLSRADHFANYAEATAAPDNFNMSDEVKAGFLCTANYNVENYIDSNDTMPVTGENNGLTIRDMTGVEYDDEKWDLLLNELSVDDMINLSINGGYTNQATDSIGMRSSTESEGVSGIKSMYNSNGGSALPVSVMTAATWNKELAQERGRILGKTGEELRVVGIYAPSMNTHRTPFTGRNFEYYSEDGTLAGYLAANEIQGASEYGLLTYIKHFALNDQETNRNNLLCTWANEQAIREIYLKPFELSVKEGGAKGVMSSFNYIGNQFAGACNSLLNTVLRDEWGFRGCVVSDWFADYGYMVSDDMIRNGGDKMLLVTGNAADLQDTKSATTVNALRTACHNILYAVANSSAMNDANYETPGWMKTMYGIDAVAGVVIVLLEIGTIIRFRKLRKAASVSIETK